MTQSVLIISLNISQESEIEVSVRTLPCEMRADQKQSV